MWGFCCCCCFYSPDFLKSIWIQFGHAKKHIWPIGYWNQTHFGTLLSSPLLTLHILSYKGSDADISIWEENIPISINQLIYTQFLQWSLKHKDTKCEREDIFFYFHFFSKWHQCSEIVNFNRNLVIINCHKYVFSFICKKNKNKNIFLSDETGQQIICDISRTCRLSKFSPPSLTLKPLCQCFCVVMWIQ